MYVVVTQLRMTQDDQFSPAVPLQWSHVVTTKPGGFPRETYPIVLRENTLIVVYLIAVLTFYFTHSKITGQSLPILCICHSFVGKFHWTEQLTWPGIGLVSSPPDLFTWTTPQNISNSSRASPHVSIAFWTGKRSVFSFIGKGVQLSSSQFDCDCLRTKLRFCASKFAQSWKSMFISLMVKRPRSVLCAIFYEEKWRRKQ